jgi:hypothetical protein
MSLASSFLALPEEVLGIRKFFLYNILMTWSKKPGDYALNAGKHLNSKVYYIERMLSFLEVHLSEKNCICFVQDVIRGVK